MAISEIKHKFTFRFGLFRKILINNLPDQYGTFFCINVITLCN